MGSLIHGHAIGHADSARHHQSEQPSKGKLLIYAQWIADLNLDHLSRFDSYMRAKVRYSGARCSRKEVFRADFRAGVRWLKRMPQRAQPDARAELAVEQLVES